MAILFCLFAGISAMAELKVAVVNATRAMFESEEAKSEFSEIEKDLVPEQQALQDLQKDIQALNDRLVKDATVISASEARDLRKQIDDKNLDFEYRGQRWEKNLQDRQASVLEKLTPKFNTVLKDIVDLEGYDLVLNMDQRIFLYVNPKHDITRLVTEKLNNLQAE